MRIYLSVPFAVGHADLPIALSTSVAGGDIKKLVGRRNLLGLRGEALVAVGLSELARTFGHRESWGAQEQIGVIACTATASNEAIAEVSSLCEAGDSRSVSILDAPNVSPNVVSSVVSIRLGAQGPCMTLDDAGGQAEPLLDLAAVLLGSGCCRTVVGMETGSDTAARGVAFVITDEPGPGSFYEVTWDSTTAAHRGESLHALAVAVASVMRVSSASSRFGDREIRPCNVDPVRVPSG